jgi:nitronate monooxygenase
MKVLTKNPFGINISVFKNSRMREEDYLRYVNIGLDEGVKVFTTSAYQAPFIGKRVHEEGSYWIQKCPLIRHTVSAEKAGADAVTLIGMESAGYKNQYQHTTLVNLTVANKLISIPIIAAGGIGDARGFLGALAMGAEAVCFGTAILSTEESPLSFEMKERWLKTDILTEDYFKKQYRFLKGGGVPSTAINYLEGKIVPLKVFIEKIMVDAEIILKSWGFSKNEFNTEASKI